MKRPEFHVNQLTDRPLPEVIEEAAREASAKVRDRNRRMGWPLITSSYIAEQKAVAETQAEELSSDTILPVKSR